MNRGISVSLAVIGGAGFIAGWVLVLWFLIGTGLMPWWIAVGPTVVFGLIGIGLLNKWSSPGGQPAPPEAKPPTGEPV